MFEDIAPNPTWQAALELSNTYRQGCDGVDLQPLPNKLHSIIRIGRPPLDKDFTQIYVKGAYLYLLPEYVCIDARDRVCLHIKLPKSKHRKEIASYLVYLLLYLNGIIVHNEEFVDVLRMRTHVPTPLTVKTPEELDSLIKEMFA